MHMSCLNGDLMNIAKMPLPSEDDKIRLCNAVKHGADIHQVDEVCDINSMHDMSSFPFMVGSADFHFCVC